MSGEVKDRNVDGIPLTEAGVDGGPEELCMLTPGNRTQEMSLAFLIQNNENFLSASLPICRQ